MSTSTAPAAAPSPRTVDALEPGDMGFHTIPTGLTIQERHAYRVGFDRGARSYGRKNPAGSAVAHEPGESAPRVGTAARAMLGRTLAAQGKAYRADRHPVAHKAAMAELRRYWTRHGLTDRAASVVDPMAPAPKAPARKRAAVAVAPVDPAPVAVVVTDVTDTAAPGDALTGAAVDSGRLTVVHVTSSPADPAPEDELRDRARALVASALVGAARDAIPDPVNGRRATRRAVAALLRSAGLAPTGPAWLAACDAAGLTGGAR